MKVISSITRQIYDIEIFNGNENKSICPECSKDRKKKKLKCFSWNAEKNIGFCNHCNATFFEFKPYKEVKQFVLPDWSNKTSLTDEAVKWFEGRMISQKTLTDLDISSSVEFMSQVNKKMKVICFPYYREKRLINIKYRDGAKNFKLVKDAELIFYNQDALKGQTECIIVEGEIDALSFIEAGIKNVVSVPNGAGSKNLDYVDNSLEIFEKIQQIFIATDNDLPGMKLRDELIRRFGAEKCLIITYRDCKDANEYLLKYSAVELADLVKTAKEVQIKDIVNINNLYDDIYALYQNGMDVGLLAGIPELDLLVKWEPGRIAVITGVPGHGKSEFLDYLIIKLNAMYGWKVAYYSPENYPIKYHVSKIVSKISGKRFKPEYLPLKEFDRTLDYLEQNFFFIYPEENSTIENILEKAKWLVRKNGIKILIIDPYNKINHQRTGNISETEYISTILDKLIMFGKQNDCLVFLVAHPRKMDKDEKTQRFNLPTLYDINGSANFYNKCDYGISIYRHYDSNCIDVHVLKVKFKHLGAGGVIRFTYNYHNGRFETAGCDINTWSKENYLDTIEVNSEPDEYHLIDEKPPF